MPTTKRKPTTKKAPTKAKSAAPIEKIKSVCQERFGWDPRVTIYETDEDKIYRMRLDKKTFTPQQAKLYEQPVLFGYQIKEIGARAQENSSTSLRVVEVKAVKQEAVAE